MAMRCATLVAALLCASCGAFSPSADDLRLDPHGHLVWAARTGDLAAIRALAAAGVDLDASTATARVFVFPDLDHRGWTALQHAVQKERIDVVRLLLECGAHPDARETGTATTPLVIAAGHEDPAIAKLLLDAGADVALGRTALTQEAPGGPLWHVVERIGEHVSGGWSRALALQRLGVARPPQR
ncbi:MAG: ankyrin repeat domain-containing protein [Vicinamibacterales bacterium]